MSDSEEVAPAVLERLRAVCLALPDAFEEQAWVGTRWKVRTRTFAHVVVIQDGRPASYARAAGSPGPLTVLTFRSSGPELEALNGAGHPYFSPGWFGDLVGVVLDGSVDDDEIAELLVESYCLLAPRKLVALVPRPTD